MPFDGITLYGVVQELKECLPGTKINKIYQPNNHEINLFVRNNHQEYKLLLSVDPINCRIHFTNNLEANPSSPPMFCMLLRKYLTGGKIDSISQLGLERIVEIVVQNTDEFLQPIEYKLIIEIMGKHSNIILLNSKNNKVIDSIKRISFNVNRHREVLPGEPYVNPPIVYKTNLLTVDANNIRTIIEEANKTKNNKTLSRWILDKFAGFSGVSAQQVALRAGIDHVTPMTELEDSDISKIIQVLIELKENLLTSCFTPCVYNHYKKKEPLDFWLFPIIGLNYHKVFSDVSVNTAVDYFFNKKRKASALNIAKHHLESQITKHLKKQKKNLGFLEEKFKTTLESQKYRLWGEILSANLYKIKPGQSHVKLTNFYKPSEEVLIPLNEKLSPSRNAQVYFNRYKKLQSTEKKVRSRISKTQMEINYLESTLLNIKDSETLEDLSAIQQELETFNYIKNPRKKMQKLQSSDALQFKSSDGFIIQIGKNNRQNDILTFKKANPDDIWLHTKNIPGSHVIIKCSKGTVSENTIREAAMLAAYFSKSRNSSNVPVDYTYVRYVKKPAGAKPGFVNYFHQKTIYVTPNKDIIEELSF